MLLAARSLQELELLGVGPAWRRLMEDLRWHARLRQAVLLLGEIGTGKSRLARRVHELGPWSHLPFVEAQLRGAIGQTGISDLWGKVRGSHTDSVESVAGWVEIGGTGTLAINDVNRLSIELQDGLVPVLDGQPVSRMGAPGRGKPVQARLVFTSNEDLFAAAAQGRMLRDFASRLMRSVVRVPALRERREDIPLLADQLVRFYSGQAGVPAPRLSREADRALADHEWPGNIRELQSVMERLVRRFHAEVEIASSMVAEELGGGATRLDVWRDRARRFDPENIRRALDRANGNVEWAADLLGCSKGHLWKVLKRMGHRRRNRRRAEAVPSRDGAAGDGGGA